VPSPSANECAEFESLRVRTEPKRTRGEKKKMMNKIKKEFEDGMKLIWKKVDPKDLKPGDHIYAYRLYGSYSHHGQVFFNLSDARC